MTNSNRMPITDAIADAETLRLFAETEDGSGLAYMLDRCRVDRWRGRNSLKTQIRRGRYFMAGEIASAAARSAFAAVPDLMEY